LANRDDVPAIRAAFLESWRAGYADLLSETEIDDLAVIRSTNDWRPALEREDRVIFVADDNGVVVGLSDFEHRPEAGREPYLQGLYVVPSHWGTGVAKALLDRALRELQPPHQVAWLEVVEAQARARCFYEREGWQLDESRETRTNEYFRLLWYRREAVDRGVPVNGSNRCAP
jgi:GNAT superfamily N-acetyltransferase